VNSFEQIFYGNTFKFTLNKSESFPKFQIELFNENKCYFKSKMIFIAKPVIQEIIDLLKTGNRFLYVSRFEFRDSDKSFFIFIKSETTIIGQTYNLISRIREDFVVRDIDKKKFLSYLERANS